MTPLSLALLVATAQIYTWVDKDGVEHFTDDANAVPRGVKARVTEGDEIGVVTADKPAKAASPAAQSNVIALQPMPQVVTIVTKSDDPNMPSAAEEKWRQLFRDARAKVTSLEDDIEADRKRTEEVNGMPVRAGFVCQTWGVPPVILTPTTSTTVTVGGGGQIAPGVAVTGGVIATSVIRPTPMFVTPCGYGFNPDYQAARDRLEKNRRELVRAKEALADLERRASFDAVPLHWRR